LGEVLTLTAALLLGLNLPLTAVMILWVNLVTDGVLTIPVGIEKGHGDALKSPPRDPSEGVFDRWSLVRMLCLAPVMATGTLLLFAYASRGGDEAVAQTIAFTTLVAFQWFHALNARSHQTSTFALSLRDNPWMLGGIGVAVLLQLAVIYIPFFADAFHTAPLTLPQWGAILLTASTILLADELLKLGWRMWQRGRT
jgi:Ca2+-transporting ATPase